MKTINLQQLIRPHLLDLKPYSSARDEFTGTAEVYLDANENSFGSLIGKNFHRYPDPYQKELKAAIAQLKKVPVEKIFLGNGSDEAIDLLIRLFCRPAKDKILIMPPTYGMYEVSARINDVEVVEMPLTEKFQIQISQVEEQMQANLKVIFICSPNNPTGNDFMADHVKAILDDFDGIVVVDEAYIDYTHRESYTRWLSAYPNLVVMQTLSKAWGIAALRLGMAFASTEIIHYLNKIKPPYNVNLQTQQLGLKVLLKKEEKEQQVEELLKQREILFQKLNKLDTVEHVYPSNANFLLIKVKNANQMYQYLMNKKVIVRDRSNVQLCGNCLRITVGTPAENDILLQAFNTFEQ
jgi:histidinol-phosphate aminotransferase